MRQLIVKIPCKCSSSPGENLHFVSIVICSSCSLLTSVFCPVILVTCSEASPLGTTRKILNLSGTLQFAFRCPILLALVMIYSLSFSLSPSLLPPLYSHYFEYCFFFSFLFFFNLWGGPRNFAVCLKNAPCTECKYMFATVETVFLLPDDGQIHWIQVFPTFHMYQIILGLKLWGSNLKGREKLELTIGPPVEIHA